MVKFAWVKDLKEYAVKYWRDNGIPLEKLIMEFTTYGRTFQLSTSDTSVCTPVFGAGSSGPYTHEAGFWAYYEVLMNYGSWMRASHSLLASFAKL
nr:acidic mammalian chitinase-like isoform X3 [Odocoileus virginianus texanus]